MHTFILFYSHIFVIQVTIWIVLPCRWQSLPTFLICANILSNTTVLKVRASTDCDVTDLHLRHKISFLKSHPNFSVFFLLASSNSIFFCFRKRICSFVLVCCCFFYTVLCGYPLKIRFDCNSEGVCYQLLS